jgi:hypothetical protein
MADYLYIGSEIRSLVIADSDIFSKINNRFYPQRIQLALNPVYPLIGFSLIGGTPDKDAYEYDKSLFEAIFASDNSLDEAIGLYQSFYGILNRAKISNTTSSFSVFEDSKPIEDSGEFAGKFIYLYSNTWLVKSIG